MHPLRLVDARVAVSAATRMECRGKTSLARSVLGADRAPGRARPRHPMDLPFVLRLLRLRRRDAWSRAELASYQVGALAKLRAHAVLASP